MSSWAHRFGWIVPSWNTVTEFEVERLNPSGVSEHFTRIAHTEDTEAAFAHMAEEAPGAAQLLGHAGVDAICYACTSGSFFRGFEYDRDFEAQLSSGAGRPVMTMAYALVAGAEALGMEKVAVAAPYEPWLMERLVTFLEGGGLTVLKSAGLGHQANILYEPSKAIELAQSAWHPEADGLIMSCGNFRTLEAIDDIESLIGKPVVTSVQASLWGLLRLTGDERAIEGAGRLMREVPRLGRPAVGSH